MMKPRRSSTGAQRSRQLLVALASTGALVVSALSIGAPGATAAPRNGCVVTVKGHPTGITSLKFARHTASFTIPLSSLRSALFVGNNRRLPATLGLSCYRGGRRSSNSVLVNPSVSTIGFQRKRGRLQREFVTLGYSRIRH